MEHRYMQLNIPCFALGPINRLDLINCQPHVTIMHGEIRRGVKDELFYPYNKDGKTGARAYPASKYRYFDTRQEACKAAFAEQMLTLHRAESALKQTTDEPNPWPECGDMIVNIKSENGTRYVSVIGYAYNNPDDDPESSAYIVEFKNARYKAVDCVTTENLFSMPEPYAAIEKTNTVGVPASKAYEWYYRRPYLGMPAIIRASELLSNKNLSGIYRIAAIDCL